MRPVRGDTVPASPYHATMNHRRATSLLSAIPIVFALTVPAWSAGPATTGAEIRLLQGFTLGSIAQMGLEIALRPGWKTYWRAPGDAGIPPSIETVGSENVAGVEVDFPAPVRFGDGYGESVGYVGPVVLPLRVRLVDPAKPARLVARVMLGICREICVPVDAALEAKLDGRPPEPRAVAAIAAAKARLPAPAEKGAALSVTAVARDATTTPESLLIEVASDRPEAKRDVLVEGPDGWALPLPRQDGPGRWRVPLEGLPPGAKADGARLLVTLVEPDRAAEQVWVLD